MSGMPNITLGAAMTMFAVATGVAGCGSPAPSADTAVTPAATSAPEVSMELHHLHGLMAHGFEMALEGANMEMLGQMQMVAGIDAVAVSHGEAMLTEGSSLITEALNGPAMAAMHTPAGGSDDTMSYTHDLGNAMTVVLDHLQQMLPVDPADANAMALHHMHLLLTHAAVMASQAATLKMTAAMRMAGPVDEEAATHVTTMFAHARDLYTETMESDAMQAAHAGAGGTGQGMTATHELGDSVNAVIDLLSKMP